MPEIFSEYQALRAAVVRLWAKSVSCQPASIRADLPRFNEAIDLALSRSVTAHVAEQERKIQRLDQVLSTVPDHACVLDPDGRFLYVNSALCSYFKLRPEQLVGKSLPELGVKSAELIESEIRGVVAKREFIRFEISSELESGRRVFHEYLFAPVINDSGEVEAVTGVARDITDQKLRGEAIWRQANFDGLTNIPNRHLFLDRLEHEVRHAERSGLGLALLFIDLDRFKEINDTLGHTTGDLLLQQAANRIRECTRSEDTVARLGGDEFTVILTGFQQPEDVRIIARKMVEKLAEPFQLGDEIVQISGSVGITLYPRDATAPADLVRNADKAMYAAKSAGRSNFKFFSDEMQREAVARNKWVADLRRGIQEQEFVVHFQPIVCLKSGLIRKAEAVIRWNHPQQGMLLSDAFIDIAEEAGLIEDIDNVVLNEAVRRSREWNGEYLFQIIVNKSTQTLANMNAAHWKIGSPDASPVSPDTLLVKITQCELMQSSPEVMRRIESLRKSGVQIALDNFGIGYSAISCLTRVKVDYLKMGQTFISELLENPVHQVIARTIIQLAHELGMSVIAEGVENYRQKDWLIESGCDYAQGFLFSEALPGDALSARLQQQQQRGETARSSRRHRQSWRNNAGCLCLWLHGLTFRRPCALGFVHQGICFGQQTAQ